MGREGGRVPVPGPDHGRGPEGAGRPLRRARARRVPGLRKYEIHNATRAALKYKITMPVNRRPHPQEPRPCGRASAQGGGPAVAATGAATHPSPGYTPAASGDAAATAAAATVAALSVLALVGT